MLYSYQKATPDNPHPGHRLPNHLKILPLIISALGLGLIASVVWPMLSYQIEVFAKDKDFSLSPRLLSPFISDMEFVANNQTSLSPQLVNTIDYTRASNWFSVPKINYPKNLNTNINAASNVANFSLSIPSLGIQDANVVVNGEDLSKSLVHYPGTALPGQLGSPVIFGHSTLPQFFDPKNYMTIFSTVPTMKLGDLIITKVDNITYTYKVKKMYQVKPEQVEILRQFYDKKTLKLITCVPPGTRFRRLIVEADLMPTQ